MLSVEDASRIRAKALAVFFAIAQVVGTVGPAFYGALIGTGTNRTELTIGYLASDGIMIMGGLVELPGDQCRGQVPGGHRHTTHRGRAQRGRGQIAAISQILMSSPLGPRGCPGCCGPG